MVKTCSECGAVIKDLGAYASTVKCYRCYKRDQTGNGRHNIKEVIKRVEKNEYVDYFGNRLIKQENKFICKCGCSKFRENDDENFVTCILCLKTYKKRWLNEFKTKKII